MEIEGSLPEQTGARALDALHRLAVAAAGVLDPAALAGLAVVQARDLLGLDSARLYWWDPEAAALRPLADSDQRRAVQQEAPIAAGEGVGGLAFQRGEPVVVADYLGWEHAIPWVAALGVRAALAAPLKVGDRVVGAMTGRADRPRSFSPQEVQLFALVAAQVGPSLEAARLYAESERRRAEAEALADLARRGAAEPDPDRLIALISERACGLLGAGYAVVTLIAPGGTIRRHRVWGAPAENWPPGDFPPGRGLTSTVLATGKTVIIERLGDNPDSPGENYPRHIAEGGRTLLGTPLIGSEATLGALVAGWRTEVRPTEAQVRLAEALAGYAATIVESAQARARQQAAVSAAAARAAELAAVIEQMPSGVVVVDAGGRVTMMNGVARRNMNGAAPDRGRQVGEYARDLGFREVGTGRRLAPEEMPSTRALAGEVHPRLEYTVLRRGETEPRWMQASAAALHDAGGRITGAVAVFSDVTRERTLLRDLGASEERLRTLYGSIACGVLVHSRMGAVVQANEAAQQMLGRSLDELRSGVWSGMEALRENGEPLPREEWPVRMALRTGQPVRGVTIGVWRPDGERRWLQVDSVPLLGSDGAPVQAVSSFLDVTQRKRAEDALRWQTSLYETLLKAQSDAGEGFLIVESPRITYANQAFCALSGYTLEELTALPSYAALLDGDGAQALDEYWHLRRSGQGGPAQLEVTLRRRDGGTVVLDIALQQFQDEGRVQTVVIARDVTERKRTEQALRESEARYRAVAELTSDFTYAVRLEPDGGATPEWVTEAYTRITGYTLGGDSASEAPDAGSPSAVPPGYLRHGWLALAHLDDRPTVLRHLGKLRAGSPDVCEFRIHTHSGEVRWLRHSARPVWDAAGRRVVRIYGGAQDITDRRRAEQALERQALYDALTGLPNRTLLLDRLNAALASIVGTDRSLALLLLDLDGFKEVNDTFGHPVGDLVLQQIGPRLGEVLRATDTVARLGGDEFAVLLPDAQSERAATGAAQRILEALQAPMLVQGLQLEIGASIGIVLAPEHGADAHTLLRRADIAMYLAKHSGGGHACYDPAQDQHSPDRLALLGELRRAIEQEQLLLHYQPLVEASSGRVVGVEALVRWRRPQRGMLPPDQFIPLAERTGLIQPLTQWVLRTALERLAAWRHAGLDLGIAINIATRSLQDPGFPEVVAALLRRNGVPPACLHLELTEGSIMADPARALEVLTRLHALGVRIVIDDFGAGYSSLAYLKRLPVDEIKIDKSFVVDLAEQGNDAAIVRSTIELGHELGLQVICEGVENRTTWDLLQALGCDLAQGFYLGGPMPAYELEQWLQAEVGRRG